MGFLSDLLTAIKRNTLDKTDIDEKIGRGLSSLATNTKNFFTQRQTSSQPTIQSSPVRSSQAYFSPYRSVAPIQSRPPAIRSFQEPKPLSLQDRVNSIVRNTDAYLSNNPTPVSSIVSKMDTGQFDPLPFTGTVAQKLVFKPTAKVLDKAIEKAYKIGKYNLQQKMPEAFDRSGLKRAEKPTTGDYLDVLGGIGVPKIASNVAGGAFGAGMDVLGSGYQVATGQKKLKDIFNNTEDAYDEGYKFASQLMPLEKGFEAIGAIAKTGIPKNVIKTVMDNPVVKKVVQSLKPEEVSGFGSFLRNTLRAGNKSGLSLSTYGALMDAKNGEERLRNIFDQYKTGFVFGSGQHAVMGGAAQLNKSIVEGKLNQFKTRADDIDVAYKNGFINKDEAVKLTEDALYNSRLAKRPKTIISKGDPSKVDLTGGLVSEKVMRSRLSKAGYSKDEINALIRKEQTVTTGGKNKVFTEDIANNLSALNKAYQNNPNVIQTKVPFVEPKTNEAVVKKTTVEEPIVKPGKPPVAVEEKVVSKPKSKLLQDILNDESLTGREKLRKFVEEGLKKKAKGNTPISEILQNKTQEADPQEELVQILRGTKGMTADQIMSKYPDIKLKKDVLAKDVYGNKVKIPDNEVLTPYELKGNKILLQDGETYIVSKNQFQNIKGNSVSKEAKEFAPELKGLEETILGEPLKDVKKTLPADYRVTSSDDWWDVTDIQGNHIVSGNSRQQAIERAIEITNIGKEMKITPEIKAKIRGEAPNFSASGKQFEEVKQSPNITKSEVQKPKETGLIENKETVLKRILEGRSSIDPEKFAKENEARIEKLKKYNVPEIQKGFTEEEQKTLRRTLEIMDNTTKDLDPSKASKILVNAMNKSPEKKQRIMNLMKDADFSKPDSIKKFWSDVKNIQSKNLSEILPEKTKEANVVDTKLKTIESVIKNSNERQGSEFIVEKANELPNYVSKKNITSNEQASSESNRFMSEHMSVGEAVKREAKKYGVKGEDIVEMIEGRKEAPKGFDKTIEAVHNYTDGLHKFRENESLGYLNDYVQHIPDKAVSSAQKINVGVDVWLPVEAVELGSTKKRLGKLGEGYSRDFDKVWERMGQEAYYDKYKGNFNISAKQREFRNKVLETIKTETEKSVEPQKSKFDFVDESSKAQEIKEKQKINYNARKGLYRFEHFVEYVGKESKSLQNAARDLRDADRIYDDFLKNKDNLSDEKWAEEIGKTLKLSRREITNISDDLKGFTGDANLLYRRGVLSNLKRVITQNFMDEVGKYEFEPETKKQLNYEIDKAIRVRAIEEGLYKKAVDMGTSLAYASQIWGNARVAIQQGTEAFRMMTIDPIASAKAFVDIIKRPQELFKKVNEYGFTENDYHNLTREVNGLAKKNDWFRKVFDKLDIVGSGPVRFFEDAKNEFFLTAYEIKGKDMGLKGKELRNYIRDNLFLNGYIMDKFNTPQYLRTPTGRLFGQYSQYFVKDMERMYDAVAIEKNPVLMAKLLTAKLASAYVMAKITGQVVDWLSMPVGFGAIPTYVKNMYQIVKDTKDEEQRAKDDPDYNSTYFRDTMKTRLINATLRTLVPFGVQYKKTSSAIDEQKKGYGETLRGRVTHKAEDDPIRILQTYFFGPSAGRYNQEFYKKEGGLFNSGADLPFYPATRKYYSASDTRSKKIKEIFASGDKERGQNMIDDNLARQDVYRDKDKELTPADREIIKSFNLRKERDENGNILDTINNKRISMSEANNKLAYPELLKFITERELEVARKTDLPLNPFYLLTPEQQRTYLNIKSLPKGDPKGKELKKISEKWLPDFYKANEKYVKDAIEQGIFTENPNFDDSRLKISPELQKKIDKYFTLDKEGRKAFIKQNPDVADYFELTRLLENVELIQMGFLPNTDSYSGGRGYSGGRKSSKSLSSFTNKSISALDRFLKSIPKEKPILISDILKKKSKPKEYKFKKINPKPSIKVK